MRVLITVKQIFDVPDSWEVGNHLKHAPEFRTLRTFGKTNLIPEISLYKWQDSDTGGLTQGNKPEDNLNISWDSLDWKIKVFKDEKRIKKKHTIIK